MKNIKAIGNKWKVRIKWPQGAGYYRRKFPTKTDAANAVNQVKVAISNGTWRQLKKELDREAVPVYTVRSFSEVFVREYCEPRMTAVGRYQHSLDAINRILGDIQLSEFSRGDAYRLMEVRAKEVAPATVNLDLAVLKSMLTFALEKGTILGHPLVRFKRLKVQEQEIRIPTESELQTFLDALGKRNRVLWAMAGFDSIMGLRHRELLGMERWWINRRDGILTVTGRTKSKKVRHIPLTGINAAALTYLDSVPPRLDTQAVWISSKGTPYRSFKDTWASVRNSIGMPWLHLHCLRHYAITQWIRSGIDLAIVQRMAGHSSIAITMRYEHLAPGGILRAVREAE